jgi:putative transposase
VQQIQYKASLVGIAVILVKESHTSKVSFLDGEPITHHKTYVGSRVQRGLFRSAKGIVLNADVNGGYNIGRKAVPKAFMVDGIEGVGVHPYSVTV